ncbi:MAG TPA: acyl carrier protein [Aliidongia sp.]|nr:acyl carrier protein [Aliidongia sp.]
MAGSLELDDEDASDAIVRLERSLGFRFADGELDDCRTVGDLFRIVSKRLDGLGGEACATAMAFYRLRRALSPYAGGETLRPSHVLSELITIPPKQLFRQVERETGLQMPPLASGWVGVAAFATAAMALLGILPVHVFYPGWTLYLILLIPAATWLFTLDPGRFGKDCRTLGDLAKRVVSHNYGHLLEAGARPTQADRWDVLTECLSGYTTVKKQDIRPDMLILPARRYAA